MASGEDFDQTGFELPPAPEAPAEATGQGLLFDDDCSHPRFRHARAKATVKGGGS